MQLGAIIAVSKVRKTIYIVELLRHKILQIEVEAWNLAQIYFLPF